jgi:hypothetical protein
MALVYSRRLGEGIFSGDNTDHPLFTVPAGRIYVVRHVVAFTTVANNNAHLERLGGPVKRFFHGTDGYQSWQEETRLTFTAGETFQLHIYVGGWHVSVDGFDFST